MRKIAVTIPIVFAILLLSFSSYDNNKDIINMGKKYKSEWEKVEKLEKKGLPKSALEVVNGIYTDALKENNPDQVIKALIYKIKFENYKEENGFISGIHQVEVLLEKSEFPQKNMLHALTASMYEMYYRANKWKFMHRTAVAGINSDDPETWTLPYLLDVIIKHRKASLEDSRKLMNISLEPFQDILNNIDDDRRPTLYDFIAHQAIDFYADGVSGISKPESVFEIEEENYFAGASTFSKISIKTDDTLNTSYHAIKTMQELIALRLNDTNKTALADVDLKRLKFVYEKSVHPLKDSLYYNALQRIYQEYEKTKISGEINLQIADYLSNRAKKYNFKDEKTHQYKNDYVKALDIYNQVIEKHKDTYLEKKALNLKNNLLSASLNIQSESVIEPGKSFPVNVSYKNISNLYYKIIPVKHSYFKEIQGNRRLSNDEILKNLLSKNSSETISINLPVDKDFREHSFNYILPKQSIGNYAIILSAGKDFSVDNKHVCFKLISVSELSYIYKRTKTGLNEFYVLNRTTGKALEGVKVTQLFSKYDYRSREYVENKGATYTTNEKGYFEIQSDNKQSRNYILEFKKGEDVLVTDNRFYNYYYGKSDTKAQTKTTIFTDRAIYRPGQTVYFKGILMEQKGNNTKIVTEENIDVTFKDVNYQDIETLSLKVNDYGTYHGSFTIPTGVLTGRMQIRTAYGTVFINVEEYKRPKFETELLPFSGNYLLGQDVEIKGKAISFSGANISNAKVKYVVERNPVWTGWYYFRPSGYYEKTKIAHGEIETDAQGNYSFKFNAAPDKSMEKSPYLSFNYSINIDVTDISGETQSTSGSIQVGYTNLKISAAIPEIINLNDDGIEGDKKKDYAFDISAKNLSGETISAEGKLIVSKLKMPEEFRYQLNLNTDKSLYTKEEWYAKNKAFAYADEYEVMNYPLEKEIYSIDFNTETNKKVNLSNFKKLEPGKYLLHIKSKDALNNEVENKQFFTVFADDNEQMPVKSALWTNFENKNYKPGDKAEFVFGSSFTGVTAMFEVTQGDKKILTESIKINNNVVKKSIDIEESHRGNLSVNIVFVRNNRTHSKSFRVNVPYKSDKLNVVFETFRNKLYPGEKEEWRLKISGPENEKVAAEMLATLYDASLDEFVVNEWNFSVFKEFYYGKSWESRDKGYFRDGEVVHTSNYKYLHYKTPQYPQQEWFGLSYYGLRQLQSAMFAKSAPISRTDDAEALEEVEVQNVQYSLSDKKSERAAPASMGSSEGEKSYSKDNNIPEENTPLTEQDSSKPTTPVKVRTNFNETAFFYPNLKTDEEGNIVVSFTVPESLTKWKMLGFAHTKDLNYALVENELITQKELMVTPNLPRFVREGDVFTLPVKIDNLSDKDLSGSFSVEFTDMLTGKKLEIATISKSDFMVKKGGSIAVEAQVSVPENLSLVSCKVSAKAGQFADGEEKPLPVLSNRVLLTETMPLPVKGKGTHKFSFDALKNNKSETIKHHAYTLEFTANPAWYAVQALPYLMEYPYECAEQTFSRFYANKLASHIANSNPRIKTIFEAWKNIPDSKALLSNLEKNQELKSVLLQESPWVQEAQDETERKKRIALLFDLNKMDNETAIAIRKLKDMQLSNGAWPWFDGMPENRYITSHIVAGMGKLNHIEVIDISKDNETWSMIAKAINYLDKELKRDYDRLKEKLTQKEMEKAQLGQTQIHYLYMRSFFIDKLEVNPKSKEAYDYYQNQAKKYWIAYGKYMQSMLAVAFNRTGEESTAQAIIKSLREFAIHHPEKGMYWKENVAGYSWYQAPIESHASIMEAFSEIVSDDKELNEMKVWLLKQKQTQDWKTTKATVEAVYALLLRGTDILSDSRIPVTTVGDKKLDPEKDKELKAEAGTGYFKKTWHGESVKPEMAEISIAKETDGVAWGAAYWQYFEDITEVKSYETAPLKLKKELYKEENTASGKVLKAIDENMELKPGDKVIVRIELKADRKMDYVHMKDMRAAGLEPINVLSRYKYQDGLGYYESTKDASTNFFFSYLPQGTYVFEYPLRVNLKGKFSAGLTTIQCMYAPEFGGRSEGISLEVK